MLNRPEPDHACQAGGLRTASCPAPRATNSIGGSQQNVVAHLSADLLIPLTFEWTVSLPQPIPAQNPTALHHPLWPKQQCFQTCWLPLSRLRVFCNLVWQTAKNRSSESVSSGSLAAADAAEKLRDCSQRRAPKAKARTATNTATKSHNAPRLASQRGSHRVACADIWRLCASPQHTGPLPAQRCSLQSPERCVAPWVSLPSIGKKVSGLAAKAHRGAFCVSCQDCTEQ